MTTTKGIGKKIEDLVKKRGLSDELFASELGVSTETVRKIYKGLILRDWTREKIALILDVSLNDFYYD